MGGKTETLVPSGWAPAFARATVLESRQIVTLAKEGTQRDAFGD